MVLVAGHPWASYSLPGCVLVSARGSRASLATIWQATRSPALCWLRSRERQALPCFAGYVLAIWLCSPQSTSVNTTVNTTVNTQSTRQSTRRLYKRILFISISNVSGVIKTINLIILNVHRPLPQQDSMTGQKESFIKSPC